MKCLFASRKFYKENSNCCLIPIRINKKREKIFNPLYIIFQVLFLFSLIYAQDINKKSALEAYKDLYLWKEPTNSLHANDTVLSVIGRWAWGPCNAVDARGNYAYIGNGPTFHVLDISEPSTPNIVGEYLTEGYVYDVELRDNTAFVCIGGWLLILDVTNPFLPRKISDIRISGVAISFALTDSFAYVTTFSGVMWLVDISDITKPYLRNSIAAGGQLAFCVEAKDGYVYIGNPEWPPMVIVDATNPDNLSRVDFEVGGWGLTAFIKDTLLFVGVRPYNGQRRLKIFNISNAASPEFVSEVEIQTFAEINGITVSEDVLTAYVLIHNQGIYSVDLTEITQPVVLDKFERTLPIGIGNTGIAFLQNSLFAAYYTGLLALDVSKSDSLKLQSFFPTGGDALELDSKENLVFAACGLSGMWILDYSNPQRIENVANVITGGLSANVMIDDTLAYIYNWKEDSETDTTIGLWIINITNPYQPKIITHYVGSVTFSPPHVLTKSSNYIFITQTANFDNDTILEIINVGDIFNPVPVSVLKGNYYPHNIAVKDTILFLATRGAGLRILNIKNPLQPAEINVFSDSSFVTISNIYENLLYVDRADTFFVLDISNPAIPYILGSYKKNAQGTALNLKAVKNYVYTTSGGVIDVNNPTYPKELESFGGLIFGYDVEAKRNIVLFSDGPVGIWLMKNNLITSVLESYSISRTKFELLQNYPNPFNPKTTIEFFIPHKDHVKIEIFDLLGQKIKTLLDKEIEAENYKIEYDAVGLSSGIYFYRMRTTETVITQKMVVLR